MDLAVNLGIGAGAEPTYYELAAQEAMGRMLLPAVQHAVAVAASWGGAAARIVRYQPEAVSGARGVCAGGRRLPRAAPAAASAGQRERSPRPERRLVH